MASPAALQPAPVDRAATVDRYGELQRRIKKFKPTREEYDVLTREIASWYEEFPANKTALAEGHVYNIQVSAREQHSEIPDIERVYRYLGRERFLQIARISLEDLRRIVPKEKWEQFILTERTGRRRLEPVLRAPAAKIRGQAA